MQKMDLNVKEAYTPVTCWFCDLLKFVTSCARYVCTDFGDVYFSFFFNCLMINVMHCVVLLVYHVGCVCCSLLISRSYAPAFVFCMW